MSRKKTFYLSLGILLAVAVVWLFLPKNTENQQIITEVKFGKFEIFVTTTGELQAENSENIMAPEGLRSIRLWNVKISDLIPEGTLVKKGDYVGTLDRTEASNNLKDIENDIEKYETDLEKRHLDTTLELGQLRDNIHNLRYDLEERQLKLEQSKFEPPATIRQEQINLEKEQRGLEQALENYKLKERKAKADIHQAISYLNNQKRKRDDIVKVLDQFTIHAPKQGMLIYAREWNGTKKKVGGMVSPWEPTVATLPDLSSMISQTFVNEIDISKVKTGQDVMVGIDAFPEKIYPAKVLEVANVGEQLPNSDAKVFQVKIKLNQTDSILKPSMTTSNSILTSVFDSVLYVPLEGIHADDSLSFVYQVHGFSTKKVQVITGPSNDSFVIIEKGLKQGDKILLTIPDKADELKLETLNE